MKTHTLFSSLVFTAAATLTAQAQQTPYVPPSPILFVTQVPPAGDHNTAMSIDGSLLATTAAAPRGGDLWIAYPDQTTKNLTRTAGYGIAGSDQKGPNAIAVRDPHVHFSGTKALFSMVKGAPANASDTTVFYWQVYEVTGLGKNDTPVITRVPNQHPDYNNVQPAYLSDGRIVFASDSPVTGERHLYPALDEDGLGPAGTGLWTVNPQSQGTVPALMTHSTSGAAEPFVDSYGRVMFTRWDVLQRDKVAANPTRVLHDYQSEAPAAAYGQYSEVFPEPLQSATTPFGLKFDLFLPWTLNQDGSNLNTLNHLGRHELSLDFPRSGPDDGMVDFTSGEFTPGAATLPATTRAGSFFQMSEHPFSPGRYVGVDVTKTGLSAGRVVSVVAPPSVNPDHVTVTVISDAGFSRDVSWLTDGHLMGAWAGSQQPIMGSYGAEAPVNTNAPTSPFSIRIATDNKHLERNTILTTLTTRTVVQIINGQDQTFSGTLHQLQPVELTPRTIPTVPVPATTPVEAPEASIYIRNGVSPTGLSTWLQQRNKALLSSRNVTTRDAADRQQPFSLQVAGGVTTTVAGIPAKTVSRVQFFQGQYLRAYSNSGATAPEAGRRVTARSMTAAAFNSNPPATGPDGSTPIAPDGSMAAIVPAGRATTWQVTDSNHNAVVRERYWLSFKAGELRACTSCHGANTLDQTGKPPATNPPEALNTLLSYWKSTNPGTPAQTSSYKVWSEVNLQNPAGNTAQADDDGDTLTNLQEFVYGSNPKSKLQPAGEARALTATPGANGATILTFTRNKDATGTEVVAESSVDLANWQESARVTDTATTNAQGVTIAESTAPSQASRRLAQYTVTVPADSSAQRQYFRLRLVVP
jgi:hypothetical protein